MTTPNRARYDQAELELQARSHARFRPLPKGSAPAHNPARRAKRAAKKLARLGDPTALDVFKALAREARGG